MYDPTIIARSEDLNPKDFPIGSVVYFLRNYRGSREQYVGFGTVIDHYTGEIAIQLWEPKDYRTIDGIPVKDFQTPTEWRKLPKGWTWNTVLFEVDWGTDRAPEEMKTTPFNIKDPAFILNAIEKGWLVKPSENDHAVFNSDIDKKYGWRIVRDYGSSEKWYSEYVSEHFLYVYATYEEAQAELDAINAEYQRIAELSDYDWSVEQIDHTLDQWQIVGHTDEERERIRSRLLALDNVDEIVTRCYLGHVQWKYDRNRRWLNIEG